MSRGAVQWRRRKETSSTVRSARRRHRRAGASTNNLIQARTLTRRPMLPSRRRPWRPELRMNAPPADASAQSSSTAARPTSARGRLRTASRAERQPGRRAVGMTIAPQSSSGRRTLRLCGLGNQTPTWRRCRTLFAQRPTCFTAVRSPGRTMRRRPQSMPSRPADRSSWAWMPARSSPMAGYGNPGQRVGTRTERVRRRGCRACTAGGAVGASIRAVGRHPRSRHLVAGRVLLSPELGSASR